MEEEACGKASDGEDNHYDGGTEEDKGEQTEAGEEEGAPSVADEQGEGEYCAPRIPEADSGAEVGPLGQGVATLAALSHLHDCAIAQRLHQDCSLPPRPPRACQGHNHPEASSRRLQDGQEPSSVLHSPFGTASSSNAATDGLGWAVQEVGFGSYICIRLCLFTASFGRNQDHFGGFLDVKDGVGLCGTSQSYMY